MAPAECSRCAKGGRAGIGEKSTNLSREISVKQGEEWRSAMARSQPIMRRVEELRAMLAAYRQMTVEEAERGDWGDVQIEVEEELWRLEQELYDTRRRLHAA
jgi:hypothetical protein